MVASRKLFALFAVLALSTAAFAEEENSAQEGQTKTTMEEVKPSSEKNKTKGEDIDKEITNKKLRAELGSKSKHSASLSMSYQGGAFEDMFGKERPNIVGDPVPVPAYIAGSVGYRYRLDPRSSLSFGFGLQWIQPFVGPQETEGHDNYGDKINISNPSVSYSYAHKVGGIQMIHGAGAYAATSDYSTGINTYGGVSYDNTVLKGFGKSGNFQMGLVTVLWTDVFGDKIGTINTNDVYIENVNVTASQQDYGVALYPFMEYVLNDTFNLRTVFRQTTFNHSKADKAWAVDRRPGSQSIGLGISVSRNVFLYPNFQFSTENLSLDYFGSKFAKESNVGMTATINMF